MLTRRIFGFNYFQVNLFIWAFFMAMYSSIGLKKHFDVDGTLTNAVYFTTTVHATVGFGDITPKTPLARWLVVAHMIAVFWAMTLLVIIIT